MPLIQQEANKMGRTMICRITDTKSGSMIPVQFRLPYETHDITYYIRLRSKGKKLFIECIHETPYVQGQILYQWLPNTCYDNLTMAEITNSIKRADAEPAICRQETAEARNSRYNYTWNPNGEESDIPVRQKVRTTEVINDMVYACLNAEH